MIQLSHFVAQHAHGGRLRKRRDRRLGAISASRPAMFGYAAALTQHVLDPLRAAGREAVEALRPHWPAVHDAPPPTIRHEVGRVRANVRPKVVGAAPAIAAKAVRTTLGSVDDKLSAKIYTSLGVQVRQALLEHGPIAETMADALGENVDLITSIADDYFDELETILADNWSNVGDWRQAVEAVEHLGEVTQSRAELIARDQVMKMNSRFNQARQQSLGVTRYEWQTVGDDRVRPAHEELEGTEHDWDEPPTDADGNTGHAGDCGINDRCTANPILDLDPDDEDAGGDEADEENDDEVEED